MESIHLSKNVVIILKKELAEKTEALNKALKRENDLKVSLFLSIFTKYIIRTKRLSDFAV